MQIRFQLTITPRQEDGMIARQHVQINNYFSFWCWLEKKKTKCCNKHQMEMVRFNLMLYQFG